MPFTHPGHDEWENPEFAQHWDAVVSAANPSRAEQLDILAAVVERVYAPGTRILDLGLGSGLVELALFNCVPEAQVVGVEQSEAMIALARQRLAPYADRCQIVRHDLASIETLALPEQTYSVAFSVQTLHHIPHEAQRAVYGFVARLLPPGGIFLHMERVALDAEAFADVIPPAWEALESRAEVKSGGTAEDFLARLRHKSEYAAMLEQHLAWLRAAGFAATCLHLQLNRALMVGVKPAR
ncbi:MAG TPA: class I SAM-dependent methyltransferase [Ktedonobacterales bacterium]|jgi:tRNA (cmo5U34)-methyltransferase|nr:class I SAM-dependent methyltransferase [Ktedonobacterales bacterium]